MRFLVCIATISASCLFAAQSVAAEEPVPDFVKDIAPIFKKHCVSCHNEEDREGKLSLDSFANLMKGGKRGPSIQPGEVNSSRMLLMISGKASPRMPPDADTGPSKAEQEAIKLWIEAGAKGPDGKQPIVRTLTVPKIASVKGPKPVSGLDLSPDGRLLAVARFGRVEILDAKTHKQIRVFSGHPGKVNDVEFSSDGKWLLVASGVSGLFGQARAWNLETGKPKVFEAHKDTVFVATMNASRTIIATGSYDRKIILWDFVSGKQLRTLDGHNGAIFDLAFHPDGSILASASADQTIKLWQVSTGIRLDTLSQPLKEQYVVRFSPDGKLLVAGGLDNRIRVWKVVSKKKPRINPLLFARIAHEGAVIQLAFADNGKRLISIADDQSMKLWDTTEFNQLHGFEKQPDVTACLTVARNSNSFVVGRADGSIKQYAFDPNQKAETASVSTLKPKFVTGDLKWNKVNETEPNNSPDQATALTLPSKSKGLIHAENGKDVDYYRFDAKAGEQWVFEINASRSKSELDSKLEILTTDGKPVQRVLLQAVRDSYIRFRGMDSKTRDCRLQNWEEMDLNQYLYLNGEVVKLWLWPRGPDSGFAFYPHTGSRHSFFDTTATSHALHEPCYIVEPHPPGTNLIPNGLPVFTINYENDDDSQRKLGSDSRLTFAAPKDGAYVIRVSDVRGDQGEKFSYELIARPRKPDFSAKLNGANPTIDPGSGKEFSVAIDRADGFEGAVEVSIEGLPPGFHATSPLVIEAGQTIGYGTINAKIGAAKPTAENSKKTKLVAKAMVHGKSVERAVNNFGEIKLAEKAKVLIAIGPDQPDATKLAKPKFGELNPLELTIAPGETITARVHIQRNDYKARIGFEAIAQSLPHGIIIDNVGLSGLLVVEGQNERQFFLTAAEWVPETTRVFHLRSKEGGAQTSWPIILHVKKK
jgi:WD40 repeat protein